MLCYICRTFSGNVILYAALYRFVLLWVLWSSICQNVNYIFPGALRLFQGLPKTNLADNKMLTKF